MKSSLLISVLLAIMLCAGCRDTQRVCKKFAAKYVSCFKATQKKAHEHHKKLSPKEAKHSAALLKKAEKKLDWKKEEAELFKRCTQKPPSSTTLACVQKTPCNKLSDCDPKKK